MQKNKRAPETLQLYTVVGLLLAVLWILMLAYGSFQERQEIESTQRDLAYLDRAAAQHTESLLRAVESDLHYIDFWLQTHSGTNPLQDPKFISLVEDIRRISGGLIDPRMVSTDGHLHYIPARSQQPLADVSDRQYYREALKLANGELYFADPVLSRVTGKWGIPVSMRLSKPVGGMSVVFAAIELDRLQAIHDTYRIPSGSLILLRTDGMLLSRAPMDAKIMGQSFAQEPWFATMLAQVQGFVTASGKNTDQRPKVFAFERLAHYPVIVAVSQTLDDALEDMRQRQRVIVAVVGLLSLMVLFFTWRLGNAQEAKRRLRVQALTARAELAAAQQALPLGLFRTDIDGHLQEVNTAWRQIHALSDEAPLQDWHTLLGPESSSASASAQSYLPEGEHVLHLPDGQLRKIRVKRAQIVVRGQVVGSSGIVEDVTERRASQRVQRMLADVFEHSTDLVIQADAQSQHYIYLNPAVRQFFGVGLDAPARDFRPTDLVESGFLERRMKECVPIALRQGYWQGETVLSDRQGRERIFSHLLIAHRDADGQLLYFSGIMRDITAFKEATQKALRSERRLQAIADHVPALLAEIDANLIYRFANKAYQDFLDIAPGSMIGRTVREVLGDAVYEEVGPHHLAAVRGERVHYMRETVREGHHRSMSVVLVPRLAEDGQTNGCYAIGFDVSELRQTEMALRQSERRLLTLTDRLPMRVSFVDAQQRYRFLNRAYEHAFSRPREVLIGRTVREVMGDAPYAAVQPHLARALQGETVSFDGEITTADGYRCYRAEYLPQYTDDGQGVLGVVAIITDTTGQKQEERRLLALSQHDALTGLLNRAGFETRLRDTLVRAQADQRWLGLMYLDIDHFKQVNDREGHLVGDLLLQGFGGRLNKAVRSTDVVARLGGDEFIILLTELDSPASAATVAQNILEMMQAPFLFESRSLAITTSIGVAVYDGRGTVTARELVQSADEQLYAAKAAGRNGYSVVQVETGA